MFVLSIAATCSDCSVINGFSGWSCSLRNHHDEIRGSRLADEGYSSAAYVSFASFILNDVLNTRELHKDV